MSLNSTKLVSNHPIKQLCYWVNIKCFKTYLESLGQHERNICLIPTTAQGTNPASTTLVGLKVVTVNIIEGKIDFVEFKNKIIQYSKNLACVMITFPSIAGIYDSNINDINNLVHENDDQVYFNGANMNTLIGYNSPGI
jgi:glycine dehydrogenase